MLKLKGKKTKGILCCFRNAEIKGNGKIMASDV